MFGSGLVLHKAWKNLMNSCELSRKKCKKAEWVAVSSQLSIDMLFLNHRTLWYWTLPLSPAPFPDLTCLCDSKGWTFRPSNHDLGSVILEKDCWYSNKCKPPFCSPSEAHMDAHRQSNNTKSDNTITTHPHFRRAQWLAGIRPLLLIGWNSVVWLGPSYFLSLVTEPGLCTIIGFSFNTHTKIWVRADDCILKKGITYDRPCGYET